MILEQIAPGDKLDQVVQAGTYWVRSYKAVSWADVEPTEGMRNWNALTRLEEELRNIAGNGMQTILSVRVTPLWAQQLEGYSCGPINPEKLGVFASFVHDLVARYSMPPYNVKYWEIWNEPDIDYHLVEPTSPWGCWGDQNDAYYGGGDFAEMLKVVYPQIKAADPQAQVLIGGLVLDCDPRPGAGCAVVGHDPKRSMFLEGILINNGGPYFDGVSFHSYDYYYGHSGHYGNPNWQSGWNTTGPVLIAKAQFIQNLLSLYGVSGKFLMNTELAILCDACSNDPTYEITKASYVAQAYGAAIAEGLRGNLWYSMLGWRNSGLLNPDLSPRPAYTAFQFTSRELRDTTWVRDITNLIGVRGYEFQRPDRRIWVLWSLDENMHSIHLPGTPLAVWDVLGNSVSPDVSMNVDLNPLYLEWNP